jgi:hypothetical protein
VAMWPLFLLLFVCHITFIDLEMLKMPCIPRMTQTRSWCVFFVDMLMNLACQYFVKLFLVPVLLILALIFIISLLLLVVDLAFPFSRNLRYNLGHSFKISLCF